MERLESIGFGGYKIYQDEDCFLYGIDAVILSNFTAKYAKLGKKSCIDLGTNTGIIPTICLAKRKDFSFIGIEMQERGYELALKGAKINGLEDKIKFIHSDILDLNGKVENGSFDIVTCNPPYLEKGTALNSEDSMKALARIESTAKLEDFLKVGSKLLKPKGELFMVNRPYRLGDMIEYGRKYKLEAKRIRLIAPRKNENPNLLLISFVKCGGKELTILPEIAVRDENSNYTKEFAEEFRQF